jgi:threonyl-tRNA synthetase
MKILQMDVDNITYEPIRPEASVYDDVKKERISVDDTLVIFVCVEKGDTPDMADKAMIDTEEYMQKLARKRLVIYPFAHLSNMLADVDESRKIIDHMLKQVPKDIDVKKAPFGWNKKLILDIKAHPLAEQSRSYSLNGDDQKVYKKAKPISVNTSLVRKSSWAGLPEEDHRTIGEKLDLYSFQEVSPAMVYWHPNGHVLYRELIALMRQLELKYGYLETSTPVVVNFALWQVSGHLEHYKDNMFSFDTDSGSFGLKPMNCPSTMLIYKSKKWSYRELPFRTATFDKIYRRELSGVVSGLFRVQELTQDDGHIFATEDQVGKEMESLLRMVKETYDTFGMKFTAKLSTMPDSHLGDENLWKKAISVLEEALQKSGMKYEVKDKEGAFYGPKIDFDVIDSIGRSWQCATIQLDYQLPSRFNLEYTAEDGKSKMPIVIHRAILGSIERFSAVMVEHYQGRFPTWLAPIQVRVVSISQQVNDYSERVFLQMKEHGIRAELDIGDKTLEHKIRDAATMRIPYTIIIGKKEQENSMITVRSRSGKKQQPSVAIEEFIEKIKKEISERSIVLSY